MSDFDTRSITEFAEYAYLNYAMYVIMDRSLPHIADGLKPVQRRIIYAMSELGLKHSAKPKKSARTVGDVLGKYHPHGDTACYEAMVLMAQPFSYRYPLIEGQGNWGSPDDPKSFAAMRYTEAKMSLYAGTLLGELGEGTVDWQDNFDGSLKEPTTLPARLPNILLNGTTGIAVGMATDIPPHNLTELIQGCIALLKNPALTIDKLLDFIPAPDLPTNAHIITSRADLAQIYKTGKGSYKMRATYHLDPKDKQTIIIDSLPYQVSGNKIIEQIAKLMNDKKAVGSLISDINDEADHENPCRIAITFKKGKITADTLMAHLFANTDLEHSYRVNMNMIGSNNKPAVKNLKDILSEWLDVRKTTVTRRLSHRLAKIDSRLHLLAGLLIAYLHLDEIIRIVREEDAPKRTLMDNFGLSELQAEAILETKLRHLAKLEEVALTAEQAKLSAEKAVIEEQLANPDSLTKLLISELRQDSKLYGDPRRCALVTPNPSVAVDELALVASEPITVVLSQSGWIRAAKGHDIVPEALNYRTGDGYLAHAQGKTSDKVYLLDSTGRSYRLEARLLPSARGQGEPITSLLKLADGASIVAMLMGADSDPILLAGDNAYGFMTNLGALDTSQKAGKLVVNLDNNSRLLVQATGEDDHVALLSQSGHLLVYPLAELPTLKKGKGNKLMTLANDDVLIALTTCRLEDKLIISAGKRTLTLTNAELAAYLGTRAKRGTLLPKGFTKVNGLVAVRTNPQS